MFGKMMDIVIPETIFRNVNLMVAIAVNLMLTTGGTITAKELTHVSAKLKLQLHLPPPRPRLQPNLLSVLIFGKMMDIVIPETTFRNVNMTVVIAAINLFLIGTLIVAMIATVSTNQSLGYGIFLLFCNQFGPFCNISSASGSCCAKILLFKINS